jgi:hypothetical protein
MFYKESMEKLKKFAAEADETSLRSALALLESVLTQIDNGAVKKKIVLECAAEVVALLQPLAATDEDIARVVAGLSELSPKQPEWPDHVWTELDGAAQVIELVLNSIEASQDAGREPPDPDGPPMGYEGSLKKSAEPIAGPGMEEMEQEEATFDPAPAARAALEAILECDRTGQYDADMAKNLDTLNAILSEIDERWEEKRLSSPLDRDPMVGMES